MCFLISNKNKNKTILFKIVESLPIGDAKTKGINDEMNGAPPQPRVPSIKKDGVVPETECDTTAPC